MTHELRYLTVQDMLWINRQVTKKVNPFHFMKLEEGTFYQYGYGGSTDLMSQAGRFLTGFLKNAPFSEGNEMTAFVAFASFLRLNGFEVTATQEKALEAASAGKVDASTISQPIPNWHPHLHPDTEEVIAEVLA